ncbi:DUF7547 family protein [Halopiger xanaduensis]|uniref:Uncharacterized protein n=1 Tax=Halopiger xanaduensis (strain DSM 18323 / JCM 14033 / SH-6) TaxID=797210 RepID=F8D6L4_HALXS|nr:hypothetical protein [Halopiger xanaduensis]AEH37754.1 hypothetical protein Halxa_3141 [Halopiger xanaduensis SH-6]
MADQDDDLADAIRELTRTLEDLRQELDRSDRRTGGRGRRGWRPPLRPPTPRELLAFADEVAVPAALAALESSIRALKAFQRGLKLVRTERDVRDRTSDAATAGSERADRLRKTTLERLDTALAELQRAASEGTLPADDEARSLLTDARELRDEVDARLREATSDGTSTEPGSDSDSSAVQIDIEEGAPDGAETDQDESEGAAADEESESNSNSNIDVDAELETLKDQYAADDEADADADDENGTVNERGSDSTPDEGNEDDEDGGDDGET